MSIEQILGRNGTNKGKRLELPTVLVYSELLPLLIPSSTFSRTFFRFYAQGTAVASAHMHHMCAEDTSRRHHIRKSPHLALYSLDGHQLERCTHVRDLGVILAHIR